MFALTKIKGYFDRNGRNFLRVSANNGHEDTKLGGPLIKYRRRRMATTLSKQRMGGT